MAVSFVAKGHGSGWLSVSGFIHSAGMFPATQIFFREASFPNKAWKDKVVTVAENQYRFSAGMGKHEGF